MKRKKEFGPWSETFDTRVKMGSVKYHSSWSGTLTNSAITLREDSKLGLYVTRSGYHSPTKPYVTVRPSSLTKVTHIVTQLPASTQYYAKYRDLQTLYPSNYQLPVGFSVPLLLNLDAIRNKAAASFIKRARDGLDILPIIGEARSTAQGIANDAHKIAQGFKSIHKRMNLPEHKTILVTKRTLSNYRAMASDLWLNYTYAYQPLVGDIVKGLVALDDLSFLSLGKASGQGSKDRLFNLVFPRSSMVTGEPNASGYPGVADFQFTGSVSYEYHAGATFNPTPGVGTYRTLGSQWSDVLPAAYELLPYSFIADYLSNLGSVVAGHSFDFTVWSNFYKSEISVIDASYTVTPVAMSSYVMRDRTIGFGSIKKVTYSRGPGSGSDVTPTFQLRYPTLSQSANLIALLSARVPSPIVKVLYGNKTR